MKEKTQNILWTILAVLLAVSLFFNGWLLNTSSDDDLPINYAYVEFYEAVVYKDYDCGGWYSVINPYLGGILDLGDRMYKINDEISSLRVPNDYTLTLYEDAGYGGASRTFSKEDEGYRACINLDSDFNDKASSLQMPRR